MNSKLSFVVIAVVVCLISVGLVNHFSHNTLAMPLWVKQTIGWLGSWLDDEQQPQVQQQPPILADKPSPTPDFVEPYSHIEVGEAPICRDTSLGKVKYKKVGEVYTWVDEKGITNYSDTPPHQGGYETLNFVGEKVFDYFTLNLNTQKLPYDFRNQLMLRLNQLFALYGKMLDVSALKKAQINLQIFDNKSAYQQLLQTHNMPINDSPNGFYSHAANKAYLLFTNNTKTMQTAVHEATHAINRAVIGRSAKWLNEGLAEYSETIRQSGQTAKVYPNTSWSHNSKINSQLLPLNVLFTAKKTDWNGKRKQQLYATSWAFVYFMMESPHRKAMLARLIRAEQENVCDVVSIERLATLFGLTIEQLQRQFSNWSKGHVKAQVI